MSTKSEDRSDAGAPGPAPRRATIKDVAASAGVSPSTVSHAISGRRKISDATKERVLRAVEELGYGADPIAASLRRGKTKLVGLVLRPKDAIRGSRGGTDNFLRLIGAASTTALDHAWGLVHIPNTVDECDITLPVDGFLVAHPYENDAVLRRVRKTRLPVVTIDAMPADAEPGWDVEIDYEGGIRAMLAGHDSASAGATALITGTERNRWNFAARSTLGTWAGDESRLHSVTELYEGEGAQGAARIAEGVVGSGAQRILAGPSRFAVGAADVASRLGNRVPGDIQIASFTDSSMAASHRPSITALDIRLDDAGTAGVELLLRRLAGLPVSESATRVSPIVNWRESMPLADDGPI